MLSYFESVNNTTVYQKLEMHTWLSKIKYGSFEQHVNYVRRCQDKTEVDRIKIKELPCVVYNFELDKQRNTENITSATGYFFIDIDVPFDIRTLNRSKIFALYKSLRGTGYHVIVKVDGLTINNYDDAYSFIIKSLQLEDVVDKCAKGKIQPSVISYDPDLFINDNSLVFDLSKLISVTPPLELFNKTLVKETFSQSGGVKKINFNCANEMEFNNEPYIADWQNINFIECRLTGKIKEGKRNKTLFAYGANLVYLNPTLSKEELVRLLHSVNISACIEPLEYKDIISIINTLFKYREEGKLKPLYRPKKRSIVFNPEAKLDYDTKMGIVHSVRREKCAVDSKNKIYEILENWDFTTHGTISQSKIVKNNAISKKTVEKYYSEFKDYILELNMNYKLSN